MRASTVPRPRRIVTLADSAGRTFGRVRGLYIRMAEPFDAYAVLRVGWTRRQVGVPLVGARYRSGRLSLAYPAEWIRTAPPVGRHRELAFEQERGLRAHYGLGGGGTPPARWFGDTELASLWPWLDETIEHPYLMRMDVQGLLRTLVRQEPVGPAEPRYAQPEVHTDEASPPAGGYDSAPGSGQPGRDQQDYSQPSYGQQPDYAQGYDQGYPQQGGYQPPPQQQPAYAPPPDIRGEFLFGDQDEELSAGGPAAEQGETGTGLHRDQDDRTRPAAPPPAPPTPTPTPSAPPLDPPPAPRRRRGRAGAFDGAGGTVRGAPIRPPARFMQGRAPAAVRPGERAGVQVRISTDAGQGPSAALSPFDPGPQGAQVLLLLHAPAFTALTPARQTLVAPADGDSAWVLFDLQAGEAPGTHTVAVTAYLGGTLLGELCLELTVGPHAVDAAGTMRAASLSAGPAQPGDVTLVVSQTGGLYRFLWLAEGFVSDEIVLHYQSQPKQAVEGLLSQLNAAARESTGWNQPVLQRWLRAKGKELWRDLVPSDLQREFWRHHDRIGQLTLVSTEDPLPWELLFPVDETGADAGFLAEQFPVVRWVRGRPAPRTLSSARASLVTAGAGLASAREEIGSLRALLGAGREPIDSLEELLDCLDAADFDVLHFAAHNIFDPDRPDIGGIPLGSSSFVPSLVTDLQDGRPFARSNPLVFMNACRTAGTATLYTRMYGWARAFLDAGAGAFVGTLWEVRDGTAKAFAEEFYRQACGGGVTLGATVSAARLAIRDEPGDPTWLAYSVYGNAHATFTPGII